MPGAFKNQVQGFTYWDSTGAGNPLARYSCVSLASAAEVTAANAAGVVGNVGEIVVQTPTAAGLPTRRVVGVADSSVRVGNEVLIVTAGVAWVMANAPIALDAPIFPAANATRTSAQTPFVDDWEMLIPSDPMGPGLTYNVCLVDDTALPAANTVHYPLGFALKAAVAQYDIIPVWIQGGYVR